MEQLNAPSLACLKIYVYRFESTNYTGAAK